MFSGRCWRTLRAIPSSKLLQITHTRRSSTTDSCIPRHTSDRFDQYFYPSRRPCPYTLSRRCRTSWGRRMLLAHQTRALRMGWAWWKGSTVYNLFKSSRFNSFSQEGYDQLCWESYCCCEEEKEFEGSRDLRTSWLLGWFCRISKRREDGRMLKLKILDLLFKLTVSRKCRLCLLKGASPIGANKIITVRCHSPKTSWSLQEMRSVKRTMHKLEMPLLKCLNTNQITIMRQHLNFLETCAHVWLRNVFLGLAFLELGQHEKSEQVICYPAMPTPNIIQFIFCRLIAMQYN